MLVLNLFNTVRIKKKFVHPTYSCDRVFNQGYREGASDREHVSLCDKCSQELIKLGNIPTKVNNIKKKRLKNTEKAA